LAVSGAILAACLGLFQGIENSQVQLVCPGICQAFNYPMKIPKSAPLVGASSETC